MFFTYIWRELRRRARQAIFIAVGLALGIGLVITVTSASAGVKDAQAQVLHSLYGVGTDITVTKTPTQGSGTGPGKFSFGGKTGTAEKPAAGTTIDDESLRSQGLGTIATSSLTKISSLSNVAGAAGGLTLTDTKITGTIPAINSSGSGSSGSGSSGGSGGSGSFGPGSGGSGGGGGGGSFSGSITPTTFSVDGVDIANGELGPLSTGKLTSGATFTSSDTSAYDAVVESNYATTNKLKVGSTITVDKKSFKVIGIVSEPSGDNPSDVYIPLGVAQSLAGMKNEVNEIYVAANSSSQVTALASSIKSAVPGSTVTDQESLASEVSGSISSAASLANNLGKWLAIAVLIAAFLLATLLTMSAVTRRVREFGTLKALGWKSGRVVGQVLGESLVVGIIGGVVGIALGFLGSSLVGKFAPALTATVGQTTSNATPGGARQFGGSGGFGGAGGAPGGTTSGGTGRGGGFGFQHANSAASTVSVHLTAPVTIEVVLVAVGLAILGGLIAGGFGGWRAARLRPAAALAKVA